MRQDRARGTTQPPTGTRQMTTLFWDVDTQVDFMRATGKLYVPGSEEILPQLAALTAHAHAHTIRILATADDHVPGHRELSDTPDYSETFPPHCMRGTTGQQKIPETALRDPLLIDPSPRDRVALCREIAAHTGDVLLTKHWFDIFTNPNTLPILDTLAPDRVVMYGVALDVCDRYAVEGLLRHRPALELTLVTDATRAIDPTASAHLLADWQSRGVRLVTTEEIVNP